MNPIDLKRLGDAVENHYGEDALLIDGEPLRHSNTHFRVWIEVDNENVTVIFSKHFTGFDFVRAGSN